MHITGNQALLALSQGHTLVLVTDPEVRIRVTNNHGVQKWDRLANDWLDCHLPMRAMWKDVWEYESPAILDELHGYKEREKSLRITIRAEIYSILKYMVDNCIISQNDDPA